MIKMGEDVCVKISGLNLSRLIDRLVAQGVLIKNLETKSKYIKFEISSDNLTALNKICKSENKFYEIVYRNGIKNGLHKLPYLLGSLVALIIVAAYIISFNLFVFNINLSYVSSVTYDINKVKNYLAESGYNEGMLRGKIDPVKLQMDIVRDFDDVSGCTVKLVGGNLYVTIYPASLKEKETVKELKSKYNGIVTKAEAFSGELNVQVGDLVKQGQVLISSESSAQGEVLGKVYFSSSIIYNDHQQIFERTGKTYTYDNLIFCKKIRVNGFNNSKFLNYHQSVCTFYLNAQLFIPIEIERVTLYEVEVKEKIVPFQNVEEEVMKRAHEEAQKQVPEGCEITNETYSVVTEGNYTRVDCFVEVEMSLI